MVEPILILLERGKMQRDNQGADLNLQVKRKNRSRVILSPCFTNSFSIKQPEHLRELEMTACSPDFGFLTGNAILITPC